MYLFIDKLKKIILWEMQLEILNHQKGLRTLFFTEMWERMSFYGMRGILVLFMTASLLEGGLEIDPVSASAVYGIYSSSVYLMALIGGWLADRHIGQQKAILYGGFIIMIGHLLLAFTSIETLSWSSHGCSWYRFIKTKYIGNCW